MTFLASILEALYIKGYSDSNHYRFFVFAFFTNIIFGFFPLFPRTIPLTYPPNNYSDVTLHCKVTNQQL